MMEYDDGGGATLAEFHGNNLAIPYPDQWRVGQRVVWVRGDQYGYTQPGMTGVVVEICDECRTKSGDEYQVFWCRPDDAKITVGGGPKFWTTPDDVRPITQDTRP